MRGNPWFPLFPLPCLIVSIRPHDNSRGLQQPIQAALRFAGVQRGSGSTASVQNGIREPAYGLSQPLGILECGSERVGEWEMYIL